MNGTAVVENKMYNPMLERLERKIDAISKKLEESDASDVMVDDWRTVGETLDRIMFMVFLVILIIITLVCFLM